MTVFKHKRALREIWGEKRSEHGNHSHSVSKSLLLASMSLAAEEEDVSLSEPLLDFVSVDRAFPPKLASFSSLKVHVNISMRHYLTVKQSIFLQIFTKFNQQVERI